MSTTAQAGDGSNAPIGAVTNLLNEHFSASEGREVEIPQREEEAEGLESSDQQYEQGEMDLEPEGEDLDGDEETPLAAAGEDKEIETFTELAEMLELDPSALYNLKYPMPDGMEPATLSAMKDAYVKVNRLGDDAINGVEDLQKQRQEFEQHVQQTQQALQMQMQVPQQFQQIDTQLQNIQAAWNNTDWAKLEKVDPGDAALQRQKLQEAASTLSNQKAQMQQQLAYQHQQSQQQFITEQLDDLFKANPDWKGKPEKIQEAWNDIIAFGTQFGMTEDEMHNIPNSRVFRMLHAAATGVKNATPDSIKSRRLTRKAAPSLRASAVRQAAGGRRKQLDKIIKRGTDSQDIRDKTAAVSALLNS